MRRSSDWFTGFFLVLPLLVGVLLLFLPSTPEVQAENWPSPEEELLPPERLIFILQYLGTDYPNAVREGRVISEFEYAEMLDFSALLLEQASRRKLPPSLIEGLAELQRAIEAKAEEELVRRQTRRLAAELVGQLQIVSYPLRAPDLERGEQIFRRDCARCHGVDGDGRGPSAAGMEPPPRSFLDERMEEIAPYQLYNAVTFGVQGTEMPSHLESLRDEERWDLAFYVLTFSAPVASHPPSLRLSLQELASFSARELLEEHGDAGLTAEGLAYLRRHPPDPRPGEFLQLAGARLAESRRAWREGRPAKALDLALQAYLQGVEPVEARLMAEDPQLVRQMEKSFLELRSSLRLGQTASLTQNYQNLEGMLDQAAERIGKQVDEGWLFPLVQSLTIILREGIEAALLLGLLIGYLSAAGYPSLRRAALGGALAGILAGVLTWVAARFLLQISPLQQEALEGITSLLAAAVLFTVCFWIIHHADIQGWKSFMRRQAQKAVGSGRWMAISAAAFLAVYREAFETVLFYQALWLRNPSQGVAILTGFAAGCLGLLGLILLMFRFGLRLPLKAFFSVTGLFLALLALLFAGYGVRELQVIGWVKETPLLWMIEIPWLEIRPTLEGLGLQVGLLLSLLLGWFQTRRSAHKMAA